MNTAAIAVMARRRKLIRTFRNAGATHPQSTLNIQQNGIRQSLIFKIMVREGILVNAGDQQFYLDEDREREVSSQRRKIVLIVLAVMIFIILVGMFGVYRTEHR